MKVLTQSQVDFYNEKGYILVDNVLSKEEIKELSDVTDTFVEKSRSVTENNEDFVLEPEHTAENPKLRRLKSPEHQHKVYENALTNKNILDIVEDLIGPNIRSHGSKLNMKAPGGGSSVEWHTDWGFYPHTNDDILEVGIPLDDMEIENGCLHAIPGSHKWDEISHHENGLFIGAVSDNSFNIEDAEPFLLKAGSISLHHVRALHGSAPNVSNRPRRLLLQNYSAADAFPIGTPVDWEKWKESMLRGSITNKPRMEKINMLWPEPKPEGVGSIFEVQDKKKKSIYKK